MSDIISISSRMNVMFAKRDLSPVAIWPTILEDITILDPIAAPSARSHTSGMPT